MDVETFRWNLIQMPEQEGITVTEACRRCDVSRKTYYKWKNRFQQEGIEGLKDRSRRPIYKEVLPMCGVKSVTHVW